jgi:hypothetical protein
MPVFALSSFCANTFLPEQWDISGLYRDPMLAPVLCFEQVSVFQHLFSLGSSWVISAHLSKNQQWMNSL